MLRRAILIVALAAAAGLALPRHADADDAALYRALGLTEIVSVMRDEGIAYGTELEGDLFLSRGGARWAAAVLSIYDQDRMQATVQRRLAAEMQGTDTAPILEFFNSERGERIVGLEVSARKALLDDDVESASRTALKEMIANNDPRLELLRDFVDANELVDANVVGAMNSNVAFYSGLAEGGAFPVEMSEAMILNDVWSQEPQIRDDTEEWVYSYLAMAYRPLDDADLEAYTAFSMTNEGQALNRAMFAAFDEMFNEISTALGRAAAGFVSGEEL